jgi:hypothetical protein
MPLFAAIDAAAAWHSAFFAKVGGACTGKSPAARPPTTTPAAA